MSKKRTGRINKINRIVTKQENRDKKNREKNTVNLVNPAKGKEKSGQDEQVKQNNSRIKDKIRQDERKRSPVNLVTERFPSPEINMPKIIYASNTDWYLYNFRLSLMKEMIHKGWEVIAIAPVSSYAEKLEREGVKFYPIKMDRKGKNPFKDLLLVWRLYRLYKREQPAIVHHFTIKPVIYGSFAAKFLPGVEVVNAVTGLGYAFKGKGIMRKVAETLYRFALTGKGYTIFQNPESLSFFVEKNLVRKEKAWLIKGSGVDIRRFAPAKDERTETSNHVVFLLASRMLWDKGVKEFVEAAKIVKEKFPEAAFWLVGGVDEGNPSSVPESWLRENTRGEGIKWLGHQEDIVPFIRKADVVTLPSYHEGLPKILLEGAAMGKPIIASDIPGCREVITNGETGVLVPIKDSLKLVDAMIDMIRKKSSERVEMGKRGRRKVVERFSDEIIISMTLDVYEKTGRFSKSNLHDVRMK